jgi:lipid A 3-O-deacylase
MWAMDHHKLRLAMSRSCTQARRDRRLRSVLHAIVLGCAGLATGGCVVTLENDTSPVGDGEDRWYTGGWRAQHDLPAEAPEGGRSWVDAGTLAVAGYLDVLPDGAPDDPPGFTTVSLVGGQEFYTPQDIDAVGLVENDRPYAGWLYAGVARYDTWLDPDPLARRDVEHAVELDVGIVGPASYAEKV